MAKLVEPTPAPHADIPLNQFILYLIAGNNYNARVMYDEGFMGTRFEIMSRDIVSQFRIHRGIHFGVR